MTAREQRKATGSILEIPIASTDATLSKDHQPGNYAAHLTLMVTGIFATGYSLSIAPLMHEFSPSDFGAILCYFGFGIIAAAFQLVGLSTLMVRDFWKSFIVCLIGCLVIWILLTLGAKASGNAFMPPMIAQTFFGVPWFCFCLQAPLLFLQYFYQWHLAKQPRTNWQYGVREILVATAILAFVSASFKFAQLYDGADEFSDWAQALLLLPIVSGVGLLTGLLYLRPIVNAATLPQQLQRWVTVTSLICIIIWSIWAVGFAWLRQDWWTVVGLTCSLLGYVSLILPCYVALSRLGYRLYRRQDLAM